MTEPSDNVTTEPETEEAEGSEKFLGMPKKVLPFVTVGATLLTLFATDGLGLTLAVSTLGVSAWGGLFDRRKSRKDLQVKSTAGMLLCLGLGFSGAILYNEVTNVAGGYQDKLLAEGQKALRSGENTFFGEPIFKGEFSGFPYRRTLSLKLTERGTDEGGFSWLRYQDGDGKRYEDRLAQRPDGKGYDWVTTAVPQK